MWRELRRKDRELDAAPDRQKEKSPASCSPQGAEEIKAIDSKSARWIAGVALRKLSQRKGS